VLVRAALEYIESHPTSLQQIRFTNFDQLTTNIFLDEFSAVFGPA
jgi:hypothetical protein